MCQKVTISLALLCVCLFKYVICVPARSVSHSSYVPKYRSDYVYIPNSRAFYKVSKERKTWFEAKITCEAEGAELAVFQTKAEAEAVQENLVLLPENTWNLCTLCDFWVGLQNLISHGVYETVKGESGVPITSVYSNWNKGEPNNQNGNEHCIVFLWNGKLNDGTCNSKLPFICKKLASTITPNNECNNYDLDYKRTSLPNQCIKFHKEPRKFGDAYMICKGELAHLAIINSKEEAKIYANEWAKYPPEIFPDNVAKNDLFLGYHDMYQENNFVTVFGEPLESTGFTDWAVGQPDNRANVEHCGGMFKNGKLNDVDCNIYAVFICEKNLDDIRDDVPS